MTVRGTGSGAGQVRTGSSRSPSCRACSGPGTRAGKDHPHRVGRTPGLTVLVGILGLIVVITVVATLLVRRRRRRRALAAGAPTWGRAAGVPLWPPPPGPPPVRAGGPRAQARPRTAVLLTAPRAWVPGDGCGLPPPPAGPPPGWVPVEGSDLAPPPAGPPPGWVPGDGANRPQAPAASPPASVASVASIGGPRARPRTGPGARRTGSTRRPPGLAPTGRASRLGDDGGWGLRARRPDLPAGARLRPGLGVRPGFPVRRPCQDETLPRFTGDRQNGGTTCNSAWWDSGGWAPTWCAG